MRPPERYDLTQTTFPEHMLLETRIGGSIRSLPGEKVLVADKENGLAHPSRYKPFRIIVPQEKSRHARSTRW